MLSPTEMEAIYERNADRVWRVCCSFMRNKHDAEDVMQDIFLKAMCNSIVFNDEQHEKAWFIVTASNMCKNALKKRFRFDEDLADYQDLAAPENDHSELMEALFALPSSQKELVYMYYYEGYSTAEIAELLHKRPSTVRSQLVRARAKMREFIEES